MVGLRRCARVAALCLGKCSEVEISGEKCSEGEKYSEVEICREKCQK